MDLNSASIILGVEGWRLLAKPAKVFLVHTATWGPQSCRTLNPKVRENCQPPHSPKGGTCGRSESFSGKPLEPPWHSGCHCHHPSSLLLGQSPDAACAVVLGRGTASDPTRLPSDCARDIVQSWLWTLPWKS